MWKLVRTSFARTCVALLACVCFISSFAGAQLAVPRGDASIESAESPRILVDEKSVGHLPEQAEDAVHRKLMGDDVVTPSMSPYRKAGGSLNGGVGVYGGSFLVNLLNKNSKAGGGK